MRLHPLIKKKDYHTMAYLSKNGRQVRLVMARINKEEEDALDGRIPLQIKRGKETFVLDRSHVIFYGEIDFNPGSDDYKILEDSKMFFPMEFQGVSIPANYDYEQHAALSDIKTARWFDTVNAALICRYAHGILNKPKRIVIFEQ